MTKSIFGTVTFRQSTLTFSATVINGLLGLAFFGLLAQVLGVAAFGLFSVTVEVLALVASIADLGTNTGLVQFISKYRKTDPTRAQQFLRLGLLTKLLVSVFVIFVGWITAPFLAEIVFQEPELTQGLRLASIGVATSLLFTFMIHALQGYQKFLAWGGVYIATNLVRLVLLFLVASSLAVNTISPELLPQSLIIYISMPAFGFLLGFLFISPKFLGVKGERSIMREFFHYNKWVAAFTLVAAISSRLDTFLIVRYLDITAVGLYAAANRLAQVVPQMIAALGTVIAPKMAEQTPKSFWPYFKKTQLMVGGLCALGLLAIPVSILFIPFIFGADFTAAIPIFWVLLVAMLVFLFSVPVHTAVIYYFSYPKLFLWIGVGHLLIIAILGRYFLEAYGATGAALAVLVGTTFNFVVPAVWVYKKVKSR